MTILQMKVLWRQREYLLAIAWVVPCSAWLCETAPWFWPQLFQHCSVCLSMLPSCSIPRLKVSHVASICLTRYFVPTTFFQFLMLFSLRSYSYPPFCSPDPLVDFQRRIILRWLPDMAASQNLFGVWILISKPWTFLHKSNTPSISKFR